MFKKLQSKFVKSNNKQSTTYTVKSGDNLWDISIKLKVSHKDLIDANPLITNPNMIYAGQLINVPATNKKVENNTASIEDASRKNCETKTYTVQSGDNLWDISIKLGVSHKDLIIANPLIEDPNLVYVGQIINVP
jgi:LysM repeat protein